MPLLLHVAIQAGPAGNGWELQGNSAAACECPSAGTTQSHLAAAVGEGVRSVRAGR
jgi:hypothetical protein